MSLVGCSDGLLRFHSSPATFPCTKLSKKTRDLFLWFSSVTVCGAPKGGIVTEGPVFLGVI